METQVQPLASEQTKFIRALHEDLRVLKHSHKASASRGLLGVFFSLAGRAASFHKQFVRPVPDSHRKEVKARDAVLQGR
jgi:hypothetical protein